MPLPPICKCLWRVGAGSGASAQLGAASSEEACCACPGQVSASEASSSSSSGEIQAQRSRAEGKGLKPRPPWSRKVGTPREAGRRGGAPGAHPGAGPGHRPCTPAGLTAEGRGRAGGGGCLAQRCGEPPRVTLTRRRLREGSRPGPAPAPNARTSSARTPGPLLGRLPATLFRLGGRSPASWPPTARGARGIPALAAPRPAGGPIPSSQNAHALLPSPTARPSRSSQNPRPLAAPARPPPHRRPGRGGGAGPRAPASRAPLFPAAVPGPPGHPPGTQASPTHGSGVWGRPEGRIQPQGT